MSDIGALNVTSASNLVGRGGVYLSPYTALSLSRQMSLFLQDEQEVDS